MKLSVRERIAAGRAHYTPDLLLLELERVSRAHRAFRERKVGEWSIELAQTDTVREDSYLQQHNSPLQPSALTTNYDFMAARTYTRPDFSFMTYNYSTTHVLDNIQLPEHLANYIYGAYDKPLEKAGLVSMLKSVEVNIDTEDKELHVCQNAKYIDDDGTELVATCSNMTQDDSDVATVIKMIDTSQGSERIDTSFLARPVPMQFRADAAQYLERTDTPMSPEAQKLFEREFPPDVLDLDLAYFTLRSMKQAMREIGMSV